MDQDDEFDFSDDGFDELPTHTLQQLETTAIRATQHQAHNLASESDYGDEDGDEVINLDYQAVVPQSTPWGAAAAPRFAQAPHQHHQQDNENGNGAYDGAMEVDVQPRQSQIDVNAMLLRLKRAEQEKARANRDKQNAESRLIAKSGEAETARRRLETERREHERRISALQQSYNETVAKQKAEMEKMRREQEQAQTSNMFLEHDLAREADKARRMKRATKEIPPSKLTRHNTVPSPTGTPKRQQKSLPFRDGFDDDDIVMASPTRNREKPKATTPKQANKRKRQVTDQSPIPALQLSEPRERPKAHEPSAVVDDLDATVLEGLRKDDRRFELLHRLVNNRSSNGKDRVLEALSQHALPSKPDKKLSSIVYDESSTLNLEQNVHNLALKICNIFLTLWSQCLQEKYYASIYLFLDALQFILAYEPCSTAIEIIESAVPILLATIDLVSVPIGRISMDKKALAALKSPAQRKTNSEINVLDCLDLLYLLATSSITSPEAIRRFWRQIPFDFPLVLLRTTQPLACIILMMRILRTSSLSDSLGVIVHPDSAPGHQQERETELVNQLSWLLFETPEIVPLPLPDAPSNSSPKPTFYTAKQILDLRLQILDILTLFSMTPYGSSSLATHRLLFGRLIKFLNEQVTSLYTSPLTSPQLPTRPLVIASINIAMKLIYHLKTSNPTVDIKSKINNTQGGSHKYLVALTRIAFSEGYVLEEGIEEEAVEAAHAILDENLTPEEGQDYLRVFSSGGSV